MNEEEACQARREAEEAASSPEGADKAVTHHKLVLLTKLECSRFFLWATNNSQTMTWRLCSYEGLALA